MKRFHAIFFLAQEDILSGSKIHVETFKLPPSERAKMRSKTFPGIAKAMAEQWGGNINRKDETNEKTESCN